jgi:2-amino-4-hydroxy-6-hydroxymethyldihydropteridine diphosphokinase
MEKRMSLLTSAATKAIIALGSNLGDSRKMILNAMARLQTFSVEPILKSSLWQTSPVDCPSDSPKFVNAMVGLVPRAEETPESLLGKLQSLEKEFGREAKKTLNEPRPLDLDLIAFGSETRAGTVAALVKARNRRFYKRRHESELILPHPRAHLRRFVLQPLSEITPDLILSGQTKTVLDLLCDLPESEAIDWLSSPI